MDMETGQVAGLSHVFGVFQEGFINGGDIHYQAIYLRIKQVSTKFARWKSDDRKASCNKVGTIITWLLQLLLWSKQSEKTSQHITYMRIKQNEKKIS